MWNASWWLRSTGGGLGPDGLTLVVKCPDWTDWMIDGPCNNCTMKEDYNQEHHHCWVRTGTPPNITAGKEGGGPTCAAGAGSIQTPGWHGFLTNGVLDVHR